MILKIKPKRILLWQTSGKKSCQQVLKSLHCDFVINGSLYDFATMKPCCDVKANGKILSDDQYRYWGYGWNDDMTRLEMCNDINKYDNYLSCIGLIKDGKKLSLHYNRDVGGVRGRTAIGYTATGEMVVYCCQDGSSGACTPERLADKMFDYGCVDALCLDGGGSTQFASSKYGNLYSPRRVANWLCVWVDSVEEKENEKSCPYAEPIGILRVGCKGTAVKWLQWFLNETMNLDLVIDGDFGQKTLVAVKQFQTKYKLTVDGVVGVKTKTALQAACVVK